MASSVPSHVRFAVFLRDGYRCRYCGCQVSRRAVGKPHHATLDHVIPQSRGGLDTKANLVTACWACNQAKRDALPGDVSAPMAHVLTRDLDADAERARALAREIVGT